MGWPEDIWSQALRSQKISELQRLQLEDGEAVWMGEDECVS